MKELNYIPNYPERDLQSLRASSKKKQGWFFTKSFK
jgi:hypothetical protein